MLRARNSPQFSCCQAATFERRLWGPQQQHCASLMFNTLIERLQVAYSLKQEVGTWALPHAGLS